jgi:hypothetical protein
MPSRSYAPSPVGTPRTDRSSTFDRGRGVSALYVFMEAGTPNVYFTRENCRTGNDDIVNSVFI